MRRIINNSTEIVGGGTLSNGTKIDIIEDQKEVEGRL